MDKLYPVGSIYLETTNTNPSTKLGGTWVAFGSSDTYLRLGGNGSGGSNSVKLSASQIPTITTTNVSANHTHKYTNNNQQTVSITPKYVQVYAWKRTA